MSPVTFVGSLCTILAILCSKIADVHGIEVHDVRTRKFIYFRKNFPIFIEEHQRRNWRSGVPAHLRTRLKEAPSSFRATRDVMLSASHVAASALLHKEFYGRERIGESNYHDSQGEFWPKLKQCLTDWTKEALRQSFRTRAFWLFPAFVLRHFLSHCCATSSRSLSDRELSAGEVPLDLAEFCHVLALAPLQYIATGLISDLIRGLSQGVKT